MTKQGFIIVLFYKRIIPVKHFNILLHIIYKTFANLSAGFWWDLKWGLKGSPLLGGEDGAWSFGPARILAVIASLPYHKECLWLHIQILIITLFWQHTQKAQTRFFFYCWQLHLGQVSCDAFLLHCRQCWN